MFTIASQTKKIPYTPINLFNKNSIPCFPKTSLLNSDIKGNPAIALNTTNPNNNTLIYSSCFISFCLGYFTHYYIKKHIN